MDAFTHELFGEDDGDVLAFGADDGEVIDEDILEASWLEEARASFDGLDRLIFHLPSA